MKTISTLFPILILSLASACAQVTTNPEPAEAECVLVEAPDLVPGGPCVTYVYDCGDTAETEQACPASSEAGE